MTGALSAWWVMSTRPSRYDQQHLMRAVEETAPDDHDDDRYLQGVLDALTWTTTGRVEWESDGLVATLRRLAGFDRRGRLPDEQEQEPHPEW